MAMKNKCGNGIPNIVPLPKKLKTIVTNLKDFESFKNVWELSFRVE